MASTLATLCFLILAAFCMHTVTAHCAFESISSNSIITTDIMCSSIPEASQVGTVVCQFEAKNAKNISLETTGVLKEYNELQIQDNADGNLTVCLFMATSYSSYVDTANGLSDIISDRIICESTDGAIIPTNIHVQIIPENTQKPTFTDSTGTYSFIDVPETVPVGADITTMCYGSPITAQDTDGNFGEENYSGAAVLFEIQGGGSEDWTVSSVVESAEWPQTCHAKLVAQSLDYQRQSSYQLVLVAKNLDGNPDQQSSTSVVIELIDSDNPCSGTELNVASFRLVSLVMSFILYYGSLSPVFDWM